MAARLREAQAEHARRIIDDFLALLRGQGRDVGEPTFNPGEAEADAHVLIDGILSRWSSAAGTTSGTRRLSLVAETRETDPLRELLESSCL